MPRPRVRWQGWATGVRISNDELLELDCDILVLAAREDQVTSANAARLQCRLVAEGANGPISLEGDAILRDRAIPILPDILTNAGGVTVSYFEWVQDLGRLFWGRDEIRAKLAEKLNDAFDRVWEISSERGLPLRTAALVAGIRDVGAALEARGLYRETDLVRDAMISDPRSLPGTASAQEAGQVLTPPEVRAVYVVDPNGALTGVLTRKTLVAKLVAAGLDPTQTRSAASRSSRITRSTRTPRSTRRSTFWRSTTPNAFRSSSMAVWSASCHAASCSGDSRRTRSRPSPTTSERGCVNAEADPPRAAG